MNQPTEKQTAAAAIKGDVASGHAPELVAKGQGVVAEELIRRAREAGIPIREDRDLLELLLQLDLHEEIPPEIYEVIPEILTFVYQVHKDHQASHPRL